MMHYSEEEYRDFVESLGNSHEVIDTLIDKASEKIAEDALELYTKLNRLREAVAAVVDVMRPTKAHDTWIAELGVAVEALRIEAGIKAPPADETHDPDRDGDRRPEHDR